MPVITNYGDSNTTGNTVLQQNLTVQGSASFYGNVYAAAPTVSLGNVTNPYACSYIVTMNTQVFNVTSVWGLSGSVGIGTVPVTSGATLQVQGNVSVSNALVTPNVYATTTNTTTLNAVSIFGLSGVVGVGTGPVTSGATLQVQGNVSVSNTLVTPNVISTLANVTTLNTSTFIATSNIGIGTLPGLANLNVLGNVVVSNALTSQNVFATLVNTSTLNTVSVFGLSGSVGIGTVPVTGGSTLQVQGNVGVSNAVFVPNVFSNLSNFVSLNTVSFFASSNVGIGTLPGLANLNVLGNVVVSNALTVQNVFASQVNVASVMNVQSLVVTSTVNVIGNVVISNALTTTNVIASLVNTTTLNVLSVFGTSGSVGVGTAPVTSGATLQIQGNVWASNALSASSILTTNINALSLNTVSLLASSNIAVGGVLAGLANLNVLGNVMISNALSVTNLFATQANVPTLNVLSVFGLSGSVGVGTVPVTGGATLQVQGNMSVTNALTTTNLLATTINVQTLNAVTLSFTFPANIGIGTVPNLANLYVLGNAYVSNALTVTNLYASTILYGEDLFRRGPYLLPSVANASTIQNWVSATCNAASQPTKSWWATSPVPSFGNVASGPMGNSDYWGGVYLPDGRVLFTPQNASNVGYFNTATGLFSSVPAGFTSGFRGGVLVPSGNVVFVPYTCANAVVLNPMNGASTNVPCGGSFQGGCLIPSGNVAFFPKGSSNIGVLNPVRLTFSNVGPCGVFGGGGTLLPNGNVAVCPSALGNIGLWNSSTVGYPLAAGAFTNVGPVQAQCESAVLGPNGNVAFFPGVPGTNVVVWGGAVGYPLATGAYTNVACGAVLEGATLLPSGNVVCAGLPLGSNVGVFDPVQLVFSNLTGTGSGYAGATLVPDGRVVFTPGLSANVGVLDTQVSVDPAFCLSPLFNKF